MGFPINFLAGLAGHNLHYHFPKRFSNLRGSKTQVLHLSALFRSATLVLCWLIAGLATAQQDTLLPQIAQDVLEDVVQDQGGEGAFNFNTLGENLEVFRRNPINLNTADEEELRGLGLLSDPQILNLLSHRTQTGPFLSVYELQAVPGFDTETARALAPYFTTQKGLDAYNQPLLNMLAEGQRQLFLRWNTVLEPQRGYQRPGDEGGYLGSPHQFYLRFRHTHSNKLSYGITAEKDRGEEFFRGSNRKGFDYYSGHLFLRDYSPTLKAVALGDFAVSFGQGLILFSGFNYGKSALATTIKRSARTLRPYTSVNEANFMRGGAATLAFGDHWEVSALVSFRRRDGNLLDIDTLDPGILRISSLDEDGLHRTQREIENRNVIGQFSTGGSVKYKFRGGHVAVNALYERLDGELIVNPQPYNRFFFSGQDLFNASVDYAWRWRNFHFFGETAMSKNGAIATLNGLLLGLDRKADLALLVRHYPRDYQVLLADPFAETSGGRNETGAYLGLAVRPFREWTLNAYLDVWRHPWLRFDIDRPSLGWEYRFRLTWYRKRRFRFYAEVREERKTENRATTTTAVTPAVPRSLFLGRLHFSYQLTKSLELRSRADFGFFDNDIDPRLRGFAVYQDILFRPMAFPLSFTARYALFDTDGFDIRFYSFENALLYSFSIPAYFNRGSRFYINVRYRPIKLITLEARYARWFYSDRETIGSGNERIDGPVRSEVAAQIRLSF